MDNKVINRAFGLLSFLTALVTYMLTVQPTVPFWDCGEFSASAIWQQVPHPPGAPLFLMIGKVFHTLIPFGDDGWRINMVSVVASAVTIWLLYMITVLVIKNFRKEGIQSLGDAIAVYGSAFIGAAAFTFSDTFWFNAVESEVYAASTLFVAVVVFLMMKWNEQADNPGHEKYLLLIAYLMGLSTGVHLLSILTIFSIVLLVYFRKYKFSVAGFIVMGIIALFTFFVIYPVVVKYIPALLAGHTPGKNEAHEYAIENSTFLTVMTVGAILAVIFGFWKSMQSTKDVLKLTFAGLLLVLLGYTTYTQILIRSNSNPPMNENEPKNFSVLASYLGREQYGDAPSWPRRYQTEDYFVQRYEERDKNGEYLYGRWIAPGRKEVQRKDGNTITVPSFEEINTSGEFAYLFKYQIDHMYIRYLLWNFVGRQSDVQDAEAAWFNKGQSEELNYKSGYAYLFPIRFFALPLLFGLIGLFFHFYKDPKMASVYFIMFLLMGVLAAIQQNQQDPQPRERDYFYAGSFMVYALWIGLGAYGIIDSFKKKIIPVGISGGVVLASLVLVPLNMAMGGWKLHSRAGNYLPFDYSYNILQSTEENAILFTNGDNDTFPLWYLQDVAGVRRDVRIVNLSLGNTLWYIDQLKNRQPWGATKIPLSFADDSIQVEDEANPMALSYDFGEPMNVTIPVKRDILSKYTNDQRILDEGVMKFQFQGKPYGEREGKMIHLFRVQDKLVLDIVRQIKWERPIYFSNTVGPDAFCGLENYFRLEGMAMRICPVPQKSNNGGEVIDPKIMEQCLMNVDNSDDFSKTPKYGFKFRNLNNPSVYYDEVHRRLMGTYRQLYVVYAEYWLKEKHNKKKAIEVIDKMNEMISVTQFPMSFDFEYRISKLFDEAGVQSKAKEFANLGIKSCMDLINNQNIKSEYILYEALGRYIGPYRYASQMYEILGQYKEARTVLESLVAVSQSLTNQVDGQELMRLQMNIADVKANIDELKINEYIRKGNNEKAYEIAKKLLEEYTNANDREHQYGLRTIQSKYNQLQRKLGIVKEDTNAVAMDSVQMQVQ